MHLCIPPTLISHAQATLPFLLRLNGGLKPSAHSSRFTVEVFANFEYLLETWTVDFSVGVGLQIDGLVDLAPGKGWSGSVANTGSAATLAYLRGTTGLSQNKVTVMEHLVTLHVLVLSDAVAGSTGSVGVSHNYTSNVNGDYVTPDDPSGQYFLCHAGCWDVRV